MRAIEQKMCQAVYFGENMCVNNTRVENKDGEITVYLHGNAIYRVVDGVRYFSLAGWNTPTTRSRLNALGCNVSQRNFQAMHDGQPIDIYAWHRL